MQHRIGLVLNRSYIIDVSNSVFDPKRTSICELVYDVSWCMIGYESKSETTKRGVVKRLDYVFIIY